MAVGRLQAITAIVMAYAIMLILVSPVVPSPLTTMRSKQTVHPPHIAAPVSVLLFTAAMDAARTMIWLSEQPANLMTGGSDIVDLNTARLC